MYCEFLSRRLNKLHMLNLSRVSLFLVYHNHESFQNSNCILGVFTDLSKAFGTIDHAILFKKLENYGVKDKSYLAVVQFCEFCCAVLFKGMGG